MMPLSFFFPLILFLEIHRLAIDCREILRVRHRNDVTAYLTYSEYR